MAGNIIEIISKETPSDEFVDDADADHADETTETSVVTRDKVRNTAIVDWFHDNDEDNDNGDLNMAFKFNRLLLRHIYQDW